MSVLELDLSDALSDEKLSLQYQPEWSAMRSGHSGRQVFHYAVVSDSESLYETEVFLSDLNTICGFCNCKASELGNRKCRHVRAVLADVIEKKPEFGKDNRV
jgi:SWIM zinc finger